MTTFLHFSLFVILIAGCHAGKESNSEELLDRKNGDSSEEVTKPQIKMYVTGLGEVVMFETGEKPPKAKKGKEIETKTVGEKETKRRKAKERDGNLANYLRGRTYEYADVNMCPKWETTFDNSSCLWPGKNFFTSIPKTCVPTDVISKMPKVVVEYYKSKSEEIIEVMSELFKQRGIKKPCGKCSLKLACRKRETEFHNPMCRPVDIWYDTSNCDDGEACQATVINGGCPAPQPDIQALPSSHPLVPAVKHYMDSNFPRFKGGDFGYLMKDMDMVDSYSGDYVPFFGTNEDSMPRSHQPLLPQFPMWHCSKSLDGTKCLCCCGDHFPDAKTGKCVKVLYGNNYPPINF